MQVWDQVQVNEGAGEHAKAAGLVIRVDRKTEVATVKLDEVAEPVAFAFSELSLLGRG